MRSLPCALALALSCSVVGSGCSGATESKCDSLSKKLVERIKTECSISSPGCGGNPGLDRPVMQFTRFHQQQLDELGKRDCPLPALGSAPLLCSKSLPPCPTGYQCCSVGGEDQCRDDCRDGGLGPDVGPRPDRGATGDRDAGAGAG